MKLLKIIWSLSFAAVAAISPFAMAIDSGWYGGGNIGWSKTDVDDERIAVGLQEKGFTVTSITEDDMDIGLKFFGGYQLIKYFAIEGGYFNLGSFGFSAITDPAGSLNGNVKFQGLNLDAVGILPFSKKFSAFGAIGFQYSKAKGSYSGTGSVDVVDPSPNKRDVNYKFGLGLEYDFIESLGMRIEAERYRLNDSVGNKGDVNLFSMGFVYRFVPPKPSTNVSVSLPAVIKASVVPSVAPLPQVVPSPPLMKVTFSANSLFEFENATVNLAGRSSLDDFAKKLKNLNFNVIRVTGHTDRLGLDAYNMKLSLKRADAVKTYLIESKGISHDKIIISGLAGKKPITKSAECIGKEVNKELIACLQSDRRVELEVFGFK